MADQSHGPVVAVNGQPPSLSSYALFAAGATTIFVELTDPTGRLLFQGTPGSITTATSFRTLMLATSGMTTQIWNLAAGATIKVSSGGPLYINTGANGDGTIFSAPTASTITAVNVTEIYTLGWVN